MFVDRGYSKATLFQIYKRLKIGMPCLRTGVDDVEHHYHLTFGEDQWKHFIMKVFKSIHGKGVLKEYTDEQLLQLASDALNDINVNGLPIDKDNEFEAILKDIDDYKNNRSMLLYFYLQFTIYLLYFYYINVIL